MVNAPVDGVVPPIAPGDGKDEVEPPNDTAVPAILIEELVRPALPSVPLNPSVTLPAEPFVNVEVKPLNAVELWKLIVVVESSPVPFT